MRIVWALFLTLVAIVSASDSFKQDLITDDDNLFNELDTEALESELLGLSGLEDLEVDIGLDLLNDIEESQDEAESSLRSLSPSGHRSKRLTVNFMGMQVSYPQYLRLMRLQEKVIKLNQMIDALHQRYSQEELSQLPQYKRLMQLHESLMPLLPKPMQNSNSIAESSAAEQQQQQQRQQSDRMKRTPFSVDFMGMQVSYPQYLRLVSLQEKVIKLDQVMRHMRTTHPAEVLERNPRWQTLVSLHESLKKLLPPEYLARYSDAVAVPVRRRKRSASTVDFNGMLVSYPQYVRLMKLQEKVLKLDAIMRKMTEGRDPAGLAVNPKWQELLTVRQSLQKLLPEGHPEFEVKTKRAGPSMEFNGVQVSYPQYLHLMNLQEKVIKLDEAMKKIKANTNSKLLEQNPKWNTLLELRQSLSKLMPGGADFSI